MSKRQVWVVERKNARGKVWRLEVVCDRPEIRPSIQREWTGIDGARYRYTKYVPEEPKR